MDTFWVCKSSTAWRGWEDHFDDLPSHCIEIGLRDCTVGVVDILETGSSFDLPELAAFAIREAERTGFPLVISISDLVYGEPKDADEVSDWADAWYRSSLADFDDEDYDEDYDDCEWDWDEEDYD